MGLGAGAKDRGGRGQCNSSGRPSLLSKHPGDVAGSKSRRSAGRPLRQAGSAACPSRLGTAEVTVAGMLSGCPRTLLGPVSGTELEAGGGGEWRVGGDDSM